MSTEFAQVLTSDPPSRAVPREIRVKRSDAIYNAHAYLTKIPYSAIVPLIEALTEPGDTVLDMFAGSGMTGVAAAITGRRAELRDISVLGQHVGTNYLTPVDPEALRAIAVDVMDEAYSRVGNVYGIRCEACNGHGTLSKAIWTFEYECPGCAHRLNYYERLMDAGWNKRAITCPECRAPFSSRNARRVSEVAVQHHVRCQCTAKLREQAPSAPEVAPSLSGLAYPEAEITADRQMFQASGLAKHGLRTTGCFFSKRNLTVLAAIHARIGAEPDEVLRDKLRFVFTAILTRASKRYQWHPKRPLNASNQNYYIAPVFYEWNVYELFERKVAAVIRADALLSEERLARDVRRLPPVTYRLASADSVDLPDASVDYVFTDPPFGSNIFYSDMSLFHEAWLGRFTDQEQEAVVDRSPLGSTTRDAAHYERLLLESLREGRRVLKPDGWLSLVFSNSTGAMWSLVQRVIYGAGLELAHVTLLDKGQRSVKGLASGFEAVVTSDLILTLRKTDDYVGRGVAPASAGALEDVIDAALIAGEDSPTQVYLSVVESYLRSRWDLAGVDVSAIRERVGARGYEVDARSGRLRPPTALSA